MAIPVNPLGLVQVFARNVVPIAGILFFGWSALNVLLLYFLDTLLMIAVIFAGLMRTFVPVDDHNWASTANSEVGYPGMALVVSAFLAVPMGVPLIFMTGGDLDGLKATLADPSFRTGVVVQFAAAFWSWLELRSAVDAGHTASELRLKRRFALVFLRWLAMLMVTYTGIGLLFGHWGAFVFVALYAGLSIVIEVAPDRFLRAMPGGAEDAEPLPGELRAPAPASATSEPKRRKGRRGP